MGRDPKIPDAKGKLPDDSGYQEEENKTGDDANVNKAGEGNKKPNPDDSGENPPKVSQEQYDKLIEGWHEDRERYQGEIDRLRKGATSNKLTKEEEDELAELSEDERVDRKIEIRKKREEALDKAREDATKSEVRFYERTNQEFADNKRAILDVASEYDCKTLKQAILIWKGLGKDKAKKNAQHHDKRKKDADGQPGGKSGGKTAVKGYDPEKDGKKSFGDIFKEGGVV